jgi:hypothetical protein
MEETPGAGAGGTGGRAEEKPLGENPFLQFVQRPRIMLVLLAIWALVGVLTNITGVFFDTDRDGLGGALAGRTLGWSGIPLAALYLYCARDPVRYQRIFWLALIEQAALIAANLYHWLGPRDDLEFGEILIPLIGSGALGTLVFLHLFELRDDTAASRDTPA